MRFDILTIFPEIFNSYFAESIIKRALESKKISIHVHNIRKFTKDKHGKVDSTPYGGGPGMVMGPQPIYDCIQHVKTLNAGPVFYMSPRGRVLTQQYAERLTNKLLTRKSKTKISSPKTAEKGLILLCGRYEGIDQRAIDLCVDDELSIGKYVLTGGELAAMVVLDTLARLIPGVLGDDESSKEESFSKALNGKKEYPHYTRPVDFMGLKVPEILQSGHHANIKKWREQNLK